MPKSFPAADEIDPNLLRSLIDGGPTVGFVKAIRPHLNDYSANADPAMARAVAALYDHVAVIHRELGEFDVGSERVTPIKVEQCEALLEAVTLGAFLLGMVTAPSAASKALIARFQLEQAEKARAARASGSEAVQDIVDELAREFIRRCKIPKITRHLVAKNIKEELQTRLQNLQMKKVEYSVSAIADRLLLSTDEKLQFLKT